WCRREAAREELGRLPRKLPQSMTAIGISLWLAPGARARLRLRRLIAELAREHGSPVFEPHVTLLPGLRLPADELRAGARELAERFTALPLEVLGPDHAA